MPFPSWFATRRSIPPEVIAEIVNPRPKRVCFFHESILASAVVLREGGPVLLCEACGSAVRNKTLFVGSPPSDIGGSVPEAMT